VGWNVGWCLIPNATRDIGIDFTTVNVALRHSQLHVDNLCISVVKRSAVDRERERERENKTRQEYRHSRA
jgi:hypothetical protein